MPCLLFQLTNHQELWAFIVTNLASVYIREGNRHQEVVGDMLHVWYLSYISCLGGCECPGHPQTLEKPKCLAFYEGAAFEGSGQGLEPHSCSHVASVPTLATQLY